MKSSTQNFNSPDHDTLIRVESKVDGLIMDVKEMKEGTASKLLDHETRLQTLEQSARDAKTVIKMTRIIAGIVGGLVTLIGDIVIRQLWK